MDSTTDDLAGDLLVGAEAIRAYLVYLGLPEDTDIADIYYKKRKGRWPIGSDGSRLVASKRKLANHARKITA